jgi:hypothetical protein
VISRCTVRVIGVALGAADAVKGRKVMAVARARRRGRFMRSSLRTLRAAGPVRAIIAT